MTFLLPPGIKGLNIGKTSADFKSSGNAVSEMHLLIFLWCTSENKINILFNDRHWDIVILTNFGSIVVLN